MDFLFFFFKKEKYTHHLPVLANNFAIKRKYKEEFKKTSREREVTRTPSSTQNNTLGTLTVQITSV